MCIRDRVGLIIGALVSLALGLAAQLLPASLCGVIGCLVWVAVTGGLHLDGVADCGDCLLYTSGSRTLCANIPIWKPFTKAWD